MPAHIKPEIAPDEMNPADVAQCTALSDALTKAVAPFVRERGFFFVAVAVAAMLSDLLRRCDSGERVNTAVELTRLILKRVREASN